jgi:hypothetical protein
MNWEKSFPYFSVIFFLVSSAIFASQASPKKCTKALTLEKHIKETSSQIHIEKDRLTVTGRRKSSSGGTDSSAGVIRRYKELESCVGRRGKAIKRFQGWRTKREGSRRH